MSLMHGADLMHLLAALGSAEKGTRKTAEDTLAAQQQVQGFTAGIAELATSPQVLPMSPHRQMAAVILKRQIKDQWSSVSQQEQAMTKQCLLRSLADPDSAVRRILHASVAQVAAANEAWPELQQAIGQALLSTDTPPEPLENVVQCITTILEEAGEEGACACAPLSVHFLRLTTAPSSSMALRQKCIVAEAQLVVSLLENDAPKETTSAVLCQLPDWFSALATICKESPVDLIHAQLVFAAVKFVSVLSRFSALEEKLSESLEVVLTPSFFFVQRLSPQYEQMIIETTDVESEPQEEDADGGPQSLVMQIMELLQTMMLRPKLRKLIKSRVGTLLRLLIPFMRITNYQAHDWQNNPNEFLANEDQDHLRCTVRICGESMVGELIERLRKESLGEVASCALELLQQGQQGGAISWKLTELGLLLFGLLAADTSAKKLQGKELGRACTAALGVMGSLLCGGSVVDSSGAPFLLRARCFWLAWRLAPVLLELSPTEIPTLVEAAASALAPSQPQCIRVTACRAFGRFSSFAGKSDAQFGSLLQRTHVLQSLGELLQTSSEESLHLILETLALVARACPEAIISVEADFVQLVLDVWQRSRSDPLAHTEVMDLVSCVSASHPHLQTAMESRLLPPVKDVLSGSASDEHAVSLTVDLFGVLIKRASAPLSPAVWNCVGPLLQVMIKSSDTGLLQNACDPLCVILQQAPAQVVDGGLLENVLQVIQKLLSPDLADEGSLFVGNVISLFVQQFGAKLSADLTTGLFQAMVVRLSVAERPFLKRSLILIFARFLLINLTEAIKVLHSIQTSYSGRTCSGFELLLVVWLDSAKDFRERYARNVSLSALQKLHDFVVKDPASASIVLPDPWPARVLLALVEGLERENERAKKLLKAAGRAAELDDNDAEDEDADLDDDDDDGTKGDSGALLSELVELDDSDDEDGDAMDIFQAAQRADPLSNVDIQKDLAAYLTGQAASGCLVGHQLEQRASAAALEAQASCQKA